MKKILHDNQEFDESCLTCVEFKNEEENKKIKEILAKSNKNNTKITVENGFLYLLSTEDKTIHKAAIETEIKEELKKTANLYQKVENSEETDKPLSKKRIREKERKERKKQRRNKETEKKEEDKLDSVSVNIPDLPLILIGSFDNYIRIIQRKSSENGKTKLVLTNVDLTPNNRFNFDINEAFLVTPTDESVKQTQIEIEIEDKYKKFKVINATFSDNYLFISFDDSSFEQWIIFDNGTVSLKKAFTSPFIFTSQSPHKIDNNSFLHVCQPILNSKEKAVSFVKMHLPFTKYYLRSENSIFLEYPYLQKISDIVDNCSHLIINRKPTNYFTSAEYHKSKDHENDKKNDEIVIKNPFEFKVSPNEMGCIIQSINSIYGHIDFIKSLINDLKDENLKRFFSSLFIKIFGLNLLYGTVSIYTIEDKIGESAMKMYRKFKDFILDVFSNSSSSNNSIDYEFMIRESIIITFSFVGKLFCLPNSFDECHSFIYNLFKAENDNLNLNLKLLLRSISYLMFYYPSSMYLIDSTIYNELIKFENDINLHELFLDSSLFTILEIRFAEKAMKQEFIENISPYFDCLFNYINHLLTDESHPIIETEEILSFLFGIKSDNAIFSLLMLKNLVSISKNLYDRIHKIPEVIQSDKEFYESNKDIRDSKVTKVTKVIESEHPYNLKQPELPEEKIKEKEQRKLMRKEEKRKEKEEKKKILEARKKKREEKRKRREERRKKNNENEQKDQENEEEKDKLENEKDKLKDEEDKLENKEDEKLEDEKDKLEKEDEEEEEENKLENEEEEYNEKDDSDDDEYSDEDEVLEELGVIDFGSDAGEIFLVVDNQTRLDSYTGLVFYVRGDDYNPLFYREENDFQFNSAIKFKSNQIRVNLLRKINKSDEPQPPCWGYKLNFIGYTFDSSFYWKPNIHLSFFNHFIGYLVQNYSDACESTEMDESEKEFQLILNENIIQGIQLEEIDNYEANMKQEKQNKENIKKSMKRTLTRGISRGINYDTNNDNVYDDQFKKSFLNDIITSNENSQTLGKQLLDTLYSKTAKQNRIRLTQSTKSILENERYLAACLFKQLGLINVCIHFIKNIRNNDEIPSNLLSLWKNIYSLRKTLFFEYQKSKSVTNSNSDSLNNNNNNFINYSEEIKRKCKLLLYSDPILKFKEKGNLDSNTIESATKSIVSFVTSKMPLSNVSEIINIRRKRLSIISQSISFMSSFIDNNNLFQSSKPIFAKMYENVSPSSNCSGVTQHELDDFSKQIGELSYKINEILLNEPSIALISTQNFLNSSLFNQQNNESRNKSSKLLIDLLEKNKYNKSFIHDRVNFVAILALLAIALKSRNSQLTDYLISLLSKNEIDLLSKKLLLLVIPALKLLIPDNLKACDKSLALSILSSNNKSPIIISNIFYWIAEIFNDNKEKDESDAEFIKKVLKGIGQAFIGKSCLFIDESFQSFAHRQVSEGMISFIRILVNYNNSTIHKIIHEILTNSITKIKINDNNNQDENLIISLGLFVSLCQHLSSFEPERKISNSTYFFNIESILGLDTTSRLLRNNGCFTNKFIKGYFNNNVMFNPNKITLNEEEIKNIFQLHEILSNSKYFTNEQKFDEEIKETEIAENILISSFYSFLPVIVQNKKNASLFMNNSNISNCLSLFKFATKSLPLKENSFLILSHYLEKAINNDLYQIKQNNQSNYIDNKGSFRFLKMNFGEINYSNENDIIKSNLIHPNLFAGSRPLEYSYESYFEVKFNKVGNQRVFLGFIDSTEYSLNEAVGFGIVGFDDIFSRRSPFLSKKLINVGDGVICNDFFANNACQIIYNFVVGDTMGVYYTKEYIYLTVNNKLTPFRMPHKSFQTYVPLIYIDHDEIELEITENITKVDLSDNKFSFLDLSKLSQDFFKEKDIDESKQFDVYQSSGEFKEKNHFIGQQVFISKSITSEKKCKFETIESFPQTLLKYREQYGIIKEIIPIDNNRFVTKMKIETYNCNTLSKEIIDIDSRYVEKLNTNFFNLIENQTNTKFSFNGSYDLNYLPQEYRNTSDFNIIKTYLKNKTIKDNSKSIAIIMTRFLSFILVDYLRYSKSTLLQDERINSEEMNIIIKSLAISLPSITLFKPAAFHNLNNEKIEKYIIFSDDNSDEQKDESYDEDDNNYKNYYKPPGFNNLFNKSFKVFLKKSETFISNQFMKKLIQESFNHVNEFNEIINSNNLFEMIPSQFRMECFSPLPKNFKFKLNIDHELIEPLKLAGFIPILVSSIPEQLPCAKCLHKKMRQTSDNISYFIKKDKYDDISIKWKYNIEELKELKFNQNKSFDPENYQNYKFKYGIFMLPKQLNEYLLFNCSLGFIQTIYILLQMLNNSNDFYKKHKEIINIEFISNLFQIASKKNPISTPFIQMIIVSFITKNGLVDSLLTHNISNSKSIFNNESCKLFEMYSFPNFLNELPLLFSIFSNLGQIRINELTLNNDNTENLSSLFDKYYQINDELFKICDDEIDKKQAKYIEGDKTNSDDDGFSFFRNKNDDDKKKKKKNFRSLYLVYYYSVLLKNEINLPYPKFLFAHDWFMQHFGGFRKVIGFTDVKKYNKNIDEKEVEFKSEVIENEFDLLCSYKYINIYNENNNDDDDDDDTDFDDDDDFEEEDEEDENDDDENKENKKKKTKKSKLECYKVFIHQIKDDSKIELPQSGESVNVSFPLEIIVNHVNGKKPMKKKFQNGNAFVVDFSPSKEQEKEYFINNYKTFESNFKEFTSLSQLDNQIADKTLIENEEEIDNNENNTDNNNENNTNNNNNENNTNNNDENNTDNNNNDDENGTDSDDTENEEEDDDDEGHDESHKESNGEEYKVYEIQRIPKAISIQLPDLAIDESVLSLRLFAHSSYRKLIEDIIISYASKDDDDDEDMSESNEERVENSYMNQIISPAYSMTTEAKFKFINQILSCEQKEESKVHVVFNRFEQQKFMDIINDTHNEKEKEKEKLEKENKIPRPLFIQFLEQVEEESIPLLKVHRTQPFSCDLVGENSIDVGGPGRELFTSLIIELMNNHIGVFTFNPNRRHNCEDRNKEDLIPNTTQSFTNDENIKFNEEIISLLQKRFVYAGALIAVCIVSALPQPMKLSSIIWDYLSHEEVSINSIYEIDNNFKELIKTAESLQSHILSNSITEEQFENVFLHVFEINDSFDNLIELIPSGSKTKVTKENLHEFIELAKNKRIHEFDNELKELKEGFDKIMTDKNLTKILRPNELKLLVCGEPNCDIEQMKKLIDISTGFNDYDDEIQSKFKQMFWNVMESFSIEERMMFIRFSSGNLGLPAPGLRWAKNIKIKVLSKEEKENGKNVVYAHTCFSEVDCPYFESEEELTKMLKMVIKFGGLITDSHENIQEITDYL